MPKRRVKIIATIGPASIEREVMEKMARAGMDMARINTAYGDLKQYETILERLRSIKSLPVILDLKGQELRVHTRRVLRLRKGDVFELGFDKNFKIWSSWDFSGAVKKEQKVLFDNGHVVAVVTNNNINNNIKLKVINGGVVADGKGINAPGLKLDLPTLSEKDHKLIHWAKKRYINWLAISFVCSGEDVAKVRNIAGSGFKIMAKIENKLGVENMEGIIRAADAVMVARGDLAVEIGYKKVPSVQKRIIAACNEYGVFDVVATELLESLLTSSKPARSDVSDIANAVLDGADGLLLSNETAAGKFPVEAIKIMANVIKETEEQINA